MLTYADWSGMDVRNYNQTKSQAQLWSRSAWAAGSSSLFSDELFSWVFMTGESFSPGMLPVPQPGAWLLSQHRGKWPSASAQRLDIVCSVGRGAPPPPTVALINSENPIRTKFRWKQVKAGAGWRGEEDEGVPASLYLIKKYKSKQKKN